MYPVTMRFRFLLVAVLLAVAGVSAHGCSCSRLGPSTCGTWDKEAVVFVGTVVDVENPANERRDDQTGESRYKFRVDEVLSGIHEREVEVYSGRGGGDCSFHFQKGRQYLVFPANNGTKLWAYRCSDTREIEFAAAMLPQLRAMRDTKKVASLYGLVYEMRQPPADPIGLSDYHFLPGIPVRITSRNKDVEAVTDAQGAFAFYDLPEGNYYYTVSLPPNRILFEDTLKDSPKLAVLPAGACYEDDLDVLPTGVIRGQVQDHDGNRLPCAGVQLFIADRYEQGGPGLYEGQCGSNYFGFKNASAGDYILVYNRQNQVDPKTPFVRSFFPGTPDRKAAATIHLGDGQKLLNQNILLAPRRPTREITVKFATGKGSLPFLNSVVAKSEDESQPSMQYVAKGIYKMFLFADEDYDLRGVGMCRYGEPMVNSNPKEVHASDPKPKELTFTYPDNPCDQKGKTHPAH